MTGAQKYYHHFYYLHEVLRYLNDKVSDRNLLRGRPRMDDLNRRRKEVILGIVGQKQGHSEFLAAAGSSINGESRNNP